MKKVKKIKKGFYSESAIFLLLNTHFWKSKIGPISSIVMPLLYMVIYAVIGTNTVFFSGLSSYLSFSILPLTIISMPLALVEFKSSIILRKISTSSITAFKFCLLMFGYYLIVTIISNLIVITLCATFLNKDAPEIFKTINWGQFIYSLLMVYISSLSVGLLLGVLIKKANQAQIFGFLILFISIILAGQLMPLSVLGSVDAIKYISLFSPISYSMSLMNNVLVGDSNEIIGLIATANNGSFASVVESCIKGQSIFDVQNPFIIFDYDFSNINGEQEFYVNGYTKIYLEWQKILNLIMPYVICISFITISVKKFNWTSR